MDSRIILKKLERIDALPTLPAVAMEVNRMLLDYDTSIKKLAKIIEKDQSIASRVLKLGNSAFYGFRSQISNIPKALILLGFNTIRNVIISVSLTKTFNNNKALEGFDIADFWKHSVAVAMVSKNLAEQIDFPSADDCFLAGLLHDIGKIVLSQFFQDVFIKIWNSAREDGISFFEAEKKEGFVEHTVIGSHLAQKWQLPAALVDCIRYHHHLSENAINFELLTIVHTANILVNRFDVESDTALDLAAFDPAALKFLRPQIESVMEWLPAMSEDIDSACNFFIEKS